MRAALVLALTLLTGMMSWAAADTVNVKVIKNIRATLQPNSLDGFTLGTSSARRGYVIEITPVSLLPGIDNGASIVSFVEPEFNGPTKTWFDVARVQLLNASQPVDIRIRVYALIVDPPSLEAR
jgi:hypothetical protein